MNVKYLPTDASSNLESDLSAAREREKIRKRIARLENQLRLEKQFKKQMELRAEIQRLKDTEHMGKDL